MKILVLGSGGREHAICWKLKQSMRCEKLYCAPGNPGISAVAECVQISVDRIPEIINFVEENKVDLTIVGPEHPLSLGVVNAFQSRGLRIFGPTQEAACLETSKSFAKQVMIDAGVRTPSSETFSEKGKALTFLKDHGAPVVLKADGLAAGKGVYVCQTLDEAFGALESLFQEFQGSSIVIEDYLVGKEASFIVATDGEQVVALPASNDYKRIFEGDRGPNTGGMGTVSPTPNLTTAQESEAIEKVIKPVLREMKKRGEPYTGFLYAGLMISPDGVINVLEFNARLGDPETQVIMRRLESDLVEVLDKLTSPVATSDHRIIAEYSNEAAVCVVLAAEGYPVNVKTGDEITGIELAAQLPGVVIFHAGTKIDSSGKLSTSGGRVLNVTARAATTEEARSLAYRACDMIQFRGRQLRRDIGK